MIAAETSNTSGRPPLLVNVGCGSAHHCEWINFDYTPSSPEVRRCDLRRGIPIGTGEADAVYHSHVLEHLSADEGEVFMRDCHRVIRTGGILRIAVPDLEQLARTYIAALDDPAGPDLGLLEWLRLELFDQFGREKPGGRMVKYIRALRGETLIKVQARLGTELEAIYDGKNIQRRSLVERLRSAGVRGVWLRTRESFVRLVARLAGGREMATAFDVGLFRASGEVHRTPYDRIALRTLLERAGFADIRIHAASESRIPRFASYGLETVGGRVRKPDSLFMEAVKH